MILEEYLQKRSKGDVGIEIECEGKRLPAEIPRECGWSVVADGSLRGGYEYIFRGAKPISSVKGMLSALNNIFEEEKSILDFSFRTSVHVHVNCLPLTYPQIMNAIYAYLLFEPVLITFSGDARKSNRFCLGISDAEGLLDIVHKLYQISDMGDDAFAQIGHIVREDEVKYSAINIASLRKHGTIEIRSMRGTTDPEIIVPWVEVLVSIRNWAKGFGCPKDIFNYVQEVGILNAFKEVSKENYDKFFYPEIEEELSMAVSLTIDLPHSMGRNKKPLRKRVVKRELFIGDAIELAAPRPDLGLNRNIPPPPQLNQDMLDAIFAKPWPPEEEEYE